MRIASQIDLTPEERGALLKLTRSGLTSVRLAQRARIVLLASTGMQNKDIAAELNVGRVQVGRWRERYAKSGLAGIERDLPRGAPARKVEAARLAALTTQLHRRKRPSGAHAAWPLCWASANRACRVIGAPKGSSRI
jgi:transposase